MILHLKFDTEEFCFCQIRPNRTVFTKERMFIPRADLSTKFKKCKTEAPIQHRFSQVIKSEKQNPTKAHTPRITEQVIVNPSARPDKFLGGGDGEWHSPNSPTATDQKKKKKKHVLRHFHLQPRTFTETTQLQLQLQLQLQQQQPAISEALCSLLRCS